MMAIITDLNINRPAENEVGLFGNIINGGTIKNLGLEDIEIAEQNNVAAFIGFSESDSGDIVGVYDSYADIDTIGRDTLFALL